MKKILAFLLPFLPTSFLLIVGFVIEKPEEEDMKDHYDEEENFVKVAIVEDKAYWVINSVLYQADVVDEEIQKEDAEPVNAFDMDYKEVNKLMNILDNIQDWKS
jgi:hypothetical protein